MQALGTEIDQVLWFFKHPHDITGEAVALVYHVGIDMSVEQQSHYRTVCVAY